MAQCSNIVIIGGGLAGPVLALSLQKHGITSTIYESRPRTHPSAGTIVLTPNALRILDRVGVYDKIHEAGYVHEEGYMTDIKGNILSRVILGSKKRYGYPAIRIYRSILRKALLEEAEKEGVSVLYDMRCMSISNETESGVDVKFENGVTVRANLVVGADGVHSKVRTYLNVDIGPEYTGRMFITGRLRRSEMQPFESPLPCFMMGSAGPFAIFPGDHEVQDLSFFATLPTEGRSKEGLEALLADKMVLKELVMPYVVAKDYPEVVGEMVTKVKLEELTCWPFQQLPEVKEYVSKLGRVVIMGDAAHAFAPNAGQGGALSLEDAASLAMTLTRANTAVATSVRVELLFHWERIRKERMNKVMEGGKGIMRKGAIDLLEGKGTALGDDDLFWMYGYDAYSAEADLI